MWPTTPKGTDTHYLRYLSNHTDILPEGLNHTKPLKARKHARSKKLQQGSSQTIRSASPQLNTNSTTQSKSTHINHSGEPKNYISATSSLYGASNDQETNAHAPRREPHCETNTYSTHSTHPLNTRSRGATVSHAISLPISVLWTCFWHGSAVSSPVSVTVRVVHVR